MYDSLGKVGPITRFIRGHAADNMKKPTATNVQYVEKNGKKAAVK